MISAIVKYFFFSSINCILRFILFWMRKEEKPTNIDCFIANITSSILYNLLIWMPAIWHLNDGKAYVHLTA